MNLSAAVLKTYRRRLTNLTSRNRSLLLATLPQGQFLDLHELDFRLNKPSFHVIATLLAGRPNVALADVVDPRDERTNVVSRSLRRIARQAKFVAEERGAEDLYVAWPFVRGMFPDGTPVHGPLLFFPVDIAQEGGRWVLRSRDGGEPFLNQSLLLAYAHYAQIRLPDDVLERDLADLPRDPLAFRTALYEWLKETPLALNFNSELFEDKLRSFDKQTLRSLTELERPGELKLQPEAVLGLFPQAGSFLVPDYDSLIGEEEDEVGKGEFGKNSSLFPSSPSLIKESSLRTPLPLDAPQEAAVRTVKAGQSLVVQGPPGTGKSQLIANLLADAAAAGQRALLVCQKRAALDVVYSRLTAVGMAPFMALIHDARHDRPALYAQLNRQIEQVDTYRRENLGLDALLLEREFDAESRKIDQLVAGLQDVKDALFDTSVCGLSPKELYLTSDPYAPAVDVADVSRDFRFDERWTEFIRRLGDYATYQQRLGSEHLWAERISFAHFGVADQNPIGRAVEDVANTAKRTAEATLPLVGQVLSVEELLRWHEQRGPLATLLHELDAGAPVRPDAETTWALAQRSDWPEAATLNHYADRWNTLLAQPALVGLQERSAVEKVQSVLQRAQAVRLSVLGWLWWQLTSRADARLLRSVLAENRMTKASADLAELDKRLTHWLELDTLKADVAPWLNAAGLTAEPQSLRLLARARTVADQLAQLPILKTIRSEHYATAAGLRSAVQALLALAENVARQRPDWSRYVSETQQMQLWEKPDVGTLLLRSLRDDFDLLAEADRLLEAFTTSERTVLAWLAGADPSAWVTTAENSLRLAWLDELERQQPQLRNVSSLRMEQDEQALQAAVLRKQTLSRDILALKLREQTYQELQYNRLNNLTSYRELKHQTTKKRNIWPVRKLMEHHADEVFQLVPVWLASPESVSVMFPLREGLFDLVIFDEASQCYAEQGIPALYRGKQLVVAGDSQQLRPSDLYRIRYDDPSDDADELPDVALEVESLLELAAQRLPALTLTGHYRSRALELVQFSNQHFYDGRLTLLPDRHVLNQHIPAIQYHNVKGEWAQNTNVAEAEAVLDLLTRLAEEQPDRSVGVVTFNYPQQQLIQEMLETAGETKAKSEATEPLFVKNIENVQGDERDIIIFSIGYAPDKRGRVTAQFGSLSQSGGENRLNVAVTRAREQIYVITSLWPEQLDVATTTFAGPKLLRAYLDYALNVARGQFQPQARPAEGWRNATLLKHRLATPTLRPELPFADLTERSDEEYQALVLTDDDQYFAQSVKESHAYLPLALAARQWPVRRVWSRAFWRKQVSA